MDQRITRQATIMAMAIFLAQPLTIGAWLALIPSIQTKLSLSKLELSLAMLGLPIAVLLVLQVAGAIVAHFGVRRLMMWALPLQCCAALLPMLANSQATLFLALAVFGALIAALEVPMNVYAGRVEKASDKLIMNTCHGFWSVGLMAGSFAAALAGAQLGLVATTAMIGAVSSLGIIAARRMPQVGEAESGERPPRRKLSQIPRALFAIGAFMFLVTIAEGALADWSAIYMSERGVANAGIAVTVFSGFMAVGRFSGDYLKRRLGALGLARVSVTLAIVGLLCLVLPLPLPVAFVGCALVGLGVASGYPLGVSAVASLDDTNEAANVAIMSTCALAGFLIGPPLIGSVAEALGMRAAFATIIPGLIGAFVLAAWLRPSKS